ncbi:MAG TPA: phosphate ABC transporter substrate-binding protein PstS [Candidatus Angelobacter sp.]|nr:phosphate ABC transporter substrate-binding protein PstS [Candidatus Angelobacter sp.]
MLAVFAAFCSVQGLAQDKIVLVGSGSSAPLPLFHKWSEAYNKRNPRMQLNYVPLGTGEGLKQISHGVGDFGAGEVPLMPEQRAEGKLIELPIAIIGIVPIYNLPDVHQELRFSGELLAEIFLGRLKTWNAPELAKLNPDVHLPNLPIKLVYRPAGKGTNYVFTDFLSKASTRFHTEVGRTPSPKWPSGGAYAERSADMIDRVKGEVGSLGYVELQYAVESHLSYGAVLNPSGKFVKASSATIAAACKNSEAPQWNKFGASLTDAPGPDSFPISSFTWVYVRTESSDSKRRAALVDLLDWMLTSGQQLASQVGYSELPSQLIVKIKEKVGSIH